MSANPERGMMSKYENTTATALEMLTGPTIRSMRALIATLPKGLWRGYVVRPEYVDRLRAEIPEWRPSEPFFPAIPIFPKLKVLMALTI